MTDLPGKPAKTLAGIWSALSEAEKEALLPHLLGDTNADRISAALKPDYEISPSSIRYYRRSLSQDGV